MFKSLNRGISTPIVIGIIVILIIVVGGGILAYQYYYIQEQEIKPPTTEENSLQTTKLFTIPEKHRKPYWVFSSAAYPIFSPDNKRFAYIVGQEREKNFVVLDGNEHKTYDYITYDYIIDPGGFSSDSKHFAYIAANDVEWPYKATRPVGGKWWVVIDGVEQKEYSNIHSFVFSADGKQFAYVASKSNSKLGSNIAYAAGEGPYYKEFIVLNGKEQKSYDGIYSPVFSPDNRRFAYIARREGKEFLVLDGEEQKNIYNQINYLSFSMDSQQIAYVAVMRPYETEFVVLDGIEQKQYEGIFDVEFHVKGKLTYRAFDKRGYFLVADGKEYANGSDPIFSQDGNHFAYVVRENENWFTVLDGVVQQYRGIIGPIALSADGKHFVYVVGSANGIKEFAVVDGIAQPERDANLIFLTFSPDGKHFFYVAQQNNQKSSVIMDEKELSQYDKVWEPRFTKDGKNLVYNALLGKDLWLIVNSVK